MGVEFFQGHVTWVTSRERGRRVTCYFNGRPWTGSIRTRINRRPVSTDRSTETHREKYSVLCSILAMIWVSRGHARSSNLPGRDWLRQEGNFNHRGELLPHAADWSTLDARRSALYPVSPGFIYDLSPVQVSNLNFPHVSHEGTHDIISCRYNVR